MTDRICADRRSNNMRRIRSKDTAPELVVRRMVHSLGFRFRLHSKDLPGRPDLVFARLKSVILVHGCFWHSHPGCKETHVPKTRQEYWRPKLEGNRTRDAANKAKLKRLGWRVLVVWECETKHEVRLQAKVKRFLSA